METTSNSQWRGTLRTLFPNTAVLICCVEHNVLKIFVLLAVFEVLFFSSTSQLQMLFYCHKSFCVYKAASWCAWNPRDALVSLAILWSPAMINDVCDHVLIYIFSNNIPFLHGIFMWDTLSSITAFGCISTFNLQFPDKKVHELLHWTVRKSEMGEWFMVYLI